MKYKPILNENADFYEVKESEIEEAEKELCFSFPSELKDFYKEVGYGFISGGKFNINRLMDPFSVCDFRQRTGEFEYFQDIAIYDTYENNKLVFFYQNESSLMSIEMKELGDCKIYYYDDEIASSLSEFLIKMQVNDNYFFDIIE